MSTDYERERLEEFIADGWTAAELGEYARQWRLNGRTYPTAQAYQLTVSLMSREEARSDLKRLRRPGYVLPPFDRLDDDDPDNPEHSEETRAAVEALARLVMASNDDRSWRNAKRGPDAATPKKLWKECFREIDRHEGLERAIDALGLWSVWPSLKQSARLRRRGREKPREPPGCSGSFVNCTQEQPSSKW
jgi:hypothetical protein